MSESAARDRAYLRLVGWFVLAIAALGLYFGLAIINVSLAFLWPLLVVVCVAMWKCGTVEP